MQSRYLLIPVILLGIVGGALIVVSLTEPGQGPSAVSKVPGSRELEGSGAVPTTNPVVTENESASAAVWQAGATRQSDRVAATTDGSASDPSTSYVEKRIQELQDLAMENDSASLKTILSELANPDPEIRKAALEAAIQFSSRDAIPGLREAADRTSDPKEKAAIEDAIEFLKLPSLTEVMQEEGRKPAPPVQRLPGSFASPAQRTTR